jgi:protein involved in polysaccharide export with SLBB domain
VALPVIGETKVPGLTPEEAAERIVSRISRYNRNVSQALVQVVEFKSRRERLCLFSR